MRLLIYTFALISAFFVSANEEYDPDTLIPAKNEDITGYTVCYKLITARYPLFNPVQSVTTIQGTDPSSCLDNTYQGIGSYSGISYTFNHETIKRNDSNYLFVEYSFKADEEQSTAWKNNVVAMGAEVYKTQSSNFYTCPPDGSPEHIIKVGENQCAKPKFADCPAGYHSKGASKALGSSECVPKDCPAAGTAENLYTSPNLGVPFSGGGMYCNDGCAYSVAPSQISTPKHAAGTSQGVACGDKPYDNKKLADEGEDDKCAIATNGAVDIMSCPNANPTTPETDPHNNDDSKVGEEGEPEKPKDNCAADDSECNLQNIEKQIENSSNSIIKNDNELHNKKIDADTKNTQAVLNIMESVDTSILLQTSQDDKLHAVTVSKFNKLIDAVNGLDVGGGGGGNGTGNGANNGTCVGEGCSDDSKYQGDCEGELCDLDIKPELEQIDSDIIDWFNEKITLPTEATSSFSTMQNFITSNFASFNGTCVPFTLDVSIAGSQKTIPVSQHCEPYETYFKPLVEWLLWTLTAMTLLNMAAQVFRSFSAV